MDKVEEYRRRAAGCQQLAENAPTQELRDTYCQLAKTWSRLAGERMEFIIPPQDDPKT